MDKNVPNPGYIKLELLSYGVCIDDNVTKIFKGQYTEKKYRFGKSDDSFSPKIVPYEIELPQNLVVGVHHNVNSPWKIKLNDRNGIGLFKKNNFVCNVKFVPRPRFWGHKLSSGIMSEDVAVLYSKHALTFFSNSSCHYWDSGNPCWFCSLKPTRANDSKVINTIEPDLAREVVEKALRFDGDIINCIKFTAGTSKDRNKGFIEAVKIWESVRPISRDDILHHLVTMPPTDLELFYDLKRIGVDTVSMSLEVTNPKIFNKLCPGKAKDIGYDGYIKAFEEAVNIFGAGNVYCALVGGLEPLKYMYNFLNMFAAKGIVPSVNIFHPDVRSKLENHSRPSVEYLKKMVRLETDIFDRYGFEPCVRGNTRNALDNECAMGFFKV